MGVKSVRSVSLGIVCSGVRCLTIFVLGTAMVRVKVFVSGFAIFFANATMLLLVLNINSSANHFVSSSTRSISPRMAFRTWCISCSALLFIQLFSNLQIVVGKNHHLTSVSTSPQKSSARKFAI